MFKNQTPYIGKIKLLFEKNPHYIGSDILNKVHLKLGFTNLVTRIKPNKCDGVWQVNPECINLIEANTGLTVKTHIFEPDSQYELQTSCINPDGVYVGSIDQGWWYYLNGLHAIKKTHPHTAWSKNAKQWIGYSHRASCAFGKGDKLFDEDWVPTDDQLLQYEKYYSKYLTEYEDEVNEWENSTSNKKVPEDQITLNIWVVGYIPFKLRGSKIIHSYEDAYAAAVNFAKYIS